MWIENYYLIAIHSFYLNEKKTEDKIVVIVCNCCTASFLLYYILSIVNNK